MMVNINGNQDNKRDLFYIIIGVSSLVITLIGSIFAYLNFIYTNNINVDNDIDNVMKLIYTDIKDGLKDHLIPINEELEQYAIGGYDSDDEGTEIDYRFMGINENDCRDIDGNNICSVYQFTVSNSGEGINNDSTKIYGYLDIKENTFHNLHYALFKGTAEEVATLTRKVVANDVKSINILKEIKLDKAKEINENVIIGDMVLIGYDVDGIINNNFTTIYNDFTKNEDDAIKKNVIGNPGDLIISDYAISNGNSIIDLSPLTQILDVGESVTYTMVLWVHKTNEEQSVDLNGKFNAIVGFTTDKRDENGIVNSLVSGEIKIG